MKKIVIVTGNPGKVRELQAMALGKLDFTMHELDIDEIQSLDLEKIVKDKAKRAYAKLHTPVIVDDVSAGLASLNGLPGPFVKYFNQRLGDDALLKLSAKDDVVTLTCLVAYYDGISFILGKGEIKGTLVASRGGENGFGFDKVVIPEGQSKTMAEMPEEEKMKISHRGKAFRSLLALLEAR